MDTDLTLRELAYDDLAACLKLASDRGWPAEDRKWGLLLDQGTGYGLFDGSGALVGTTLVTRFSGEHAALSMVLVASTHGGQGLGTRLVEHALEHAGCPVVSLHATALGRPLYEKLGFRSVARLTTYSGSFAPGELSGTTRAALRADLPAVVEADAAVFGANRGELWKDYFRLADQVRLDGAGGFAATWRSVDGLAVGPVVAGSVEEARTLISDLAVGADGDLKVDAYRDELGSWLVRKGLVERGSVDLMVFGATDVPGDRARLHVPLMQALG
ncbi:GNAT family N-acetyltransferase [Umezawaea endophytica]|uniref:GNAT family N-acetyltransferase n=1 Tax=Umezawaea endophytica TaxID=1654476 RepID=A0A9X3ADP9_9PSEU|nr:GNAT family N-acetyltransferase [Umezawaea endophytica]MCS7476342.1 GNAT family N-acetyltransferase [Umezawaea endophytica]